VCLGKTKTLKNIEKKKAFVCVTTKECDLSFIKEVYGRICLVVSVAEKENEYEE